ncbi:MAG TPA: VOC family protein [Acidimicrobiia bacterium]|nr:VOC family protein [Acidimicrobiia bacterium]
MRVTRVLHTSVNTTRAIDETARFYGEVLGLTTVDRPDIGIPGQWYAVGDAQMHLIGFPESGTELDPTRHHVCLGVADLAAALAELDERGIAYFRGEQHQPGRTVQQVFLCDPAGNVLELQEDAE